MTASDTVGLAGWSVVIYNEIGQFVTLIGTGSSTERVLFRETSWSGLDQHDQLVQQGRYRILFAVSDRSSNQTQSELWISIR
jgi:hypothetical protein